MEIYNSYIQPRLLDIEVHKTFQEKHPAVSDLFEQTSEKKETSSCLSKSFFCCCPTEPADEVLEEFDLLEKIKKMKDFGDHWAQKDSLSEYTSIYYSLPKEVRNQLKEIATENYIERYESKRKIWRIQSDEASEKGNQKILKKIAKEQILNISHSASDEILSRYIKDPTSRHPKLKEEAPFRQRVIGLVLAPFRKIAELVSTIFQKIFFCSSKKMSEEKILKIVQAMLDTINYPDVYSIRKIDTLFKSLPSDVQTKLKDDLIDQYSKYMSDEKMHLTKEDQEAWKEQNYKTLEQIALGFILSMEFNKSQVAPILEKYIDELKAN